jgi:hypothetical protein
MGTHGKPDRPRPAKMQIVPSAYPAAEKSASGSEYVRAVAGDENSGSGRAKYSGAIGLPNLSHWQTRPTSDPTSSTPGSTGLAVIDSAPPSLCRGEE